MKNNKSCKKGPVFLDIYPLICASILTTVPTNVCYWPKKNYNSEIFCEGTWRDFCWFTVDGPIIECVNSSGKAFLMCKCKICNLN